MQTRCSKSRYELRKMAAGFTGKPGADPDELKTDKTHTSPPAPKAARKFPSPDKSLKKAPKTPANAEAASHANVEASPEKSGSTAASLLAAKRKKHRRE